MEEDWKLSFDRDVEFPQLKGNTYLDHAGATLYSRSQISEYSALLTNNLFSNPHSRHSSSQLTTQRIANIRSRILSFFNCNSAEYSVVFTSGATAGLKTVAETFDFGQNGLFVHLRDMHTSVVGMRELVKHRGASVACVNQINQIDQLAALNTQPKLLAIPAQCNFSGTKYNLDHIHRWQREDGWRVLLDVSSFVATSRLDLSHIQPDFLVLSFYKLFGFPTGLGALLVRRDAEASLKKVYFGGGSVELAVGEEQFHAFRPDFVERFEDGTLSFLEILALDCGFQALEMLGGGMERIAQHTFRLAQYTHDELSKLKHSNGESVVRMYNDTAFSAPSSQGPLVTFNLLRPDQSVVGFATIEKVMESFGIQVRTGCFCNTGACQKYLGLTTAELKANLQAGHVCGDNVDTINGQVTGAVRASFGYMSTKSDADALITVIGQVFVHNTPLHSPPPEIHHDSRVVTQMYLYPVKSCRGLKVEKWPIGPDGFQYDRQFFIQNSAGTTMTLKHNPRLYGIQCQIELDRPSLTLSAAGQTDLTIGLSQPCACGFLKSMLDMVRNEEDENKENDGLVSSRICGQKVRAFDCGEAGGRWLTGYFQDSTTYSLLKYGHRPLSLNSPSRSAANSAPFLIICTASIQYLISSISDQSSFTMDDIIERMRPNVVVQTERPFEEDNWNTIRIGNVEFELIEPCSRCHLISVDLKSGGGRTAEPLRSIARLRGEKMHFGVLMQAMVDDNHHQAQCHLQLADAVSIVNASS